MPTPTLPNIDIQDVFLEDIFVDPANARLHGPKNMQAIKSSLRQFGQVEPLLCQRSSGKIIGGNGRFEAMQTLGWKKCRVSYLDIGEVEATALGLALNRTAELAEWDAEALEKLSDSLEDTDIDLEGLALDLHSLENIEDPHPSEGYEDPELETENVPDVGDVDDKEIPAKCPSRVKVNQRWQLGRHFLFCGDSTKKEDVKRLLNGAKADIVFTSPPYGQQRDYGAKINDWDNMMEGVFACIPDISHVRTQLLVNLGLIHQDKQYVPYWRKFLDFMVAQGWRRFGLYVWDKKCAHPGGVERGRLGASFELIWHFNKESFVRKSAINASAGRNYDTLSSGFQYSKEGKKGEAGNLENKVADPLRIRDDVFRVAKNSVQTGHPAVFPVALPAEAFCAFSKDEGICYEPFAGSGSSFLAAEKTNRICYAMEICPDYCDIILSRFEELTSEKAVLLHDLSPKLA